ncbi:ras-2 protein [Stylonychia lemnae]|uniref:Ras-2 protein n=1 Tax=Stylonychia lemnae TaxID=5949 RepID=A0A078AAS6_STYLE|nr:ras-2 protein [Stylonychia lemnae]|eukprot:CDW77883.1 ras-2 protein [Stylonychia lemnae]
MSVEDYSKQIFEAINKLKITDQDITQHQRLGSFYEVSDSPLVSPSREKIFVDDLQDHWMKMNELESDHSSIMEQSYEEQYVPSMIKKSKTNFQSGKKTPFEIEQELLSELSLLEKQDSDRHKGIQPFHEDYINSDSRKITQDAIDRIFDINFNVNDDLQKRLEHKKNELRNGAKMNQGIRQIDMNQYNVDDIIMGKSGKKINNYLSTDNSELEAPYSHYEYKAFNQQFGLQENQLTKETPRFMEESGRPTKKLSNIGLDMNELKLSSKILNYEQADQEDSNLLNSPDTSIYDTKLIYDTSQVKAQTPLQSPGPRRRIHFNQGSFDMRGINLGYSQDNTLDQISSIDDNSICRDIDRAKSENRIPMFNGMFSPSNVTSERNTIYQGNQYLRRDMQADAEDKYSDKTMQSVFNQFQSNNTSFVGINHHSDNDITNKMLKDFYQHSGKKIMIVEEEIGDIDIKIEYNEQNNQDIYEWNKIVNEAKDSLQKSQDIQLSQSKSQTGITNQNQSNMEKTNISNNAQKTYLRHLIKKKPLDQDDQLINFTTLLGMNGNSVSTYSNKLLLNTDSHQLLEDCIIFLVLIGRKNFHTYLLSDQEANRQRILYSNLLKKNESHEAYFGLAKIYFYLNKLEQAYDFICRAIQMKQNDGLYYLWQGFILYYLVSYSSNRLKKEEQVQKVKKYLKESERALNKALKLNNKSVAIMYLLLKLSVWSEKNKKKYKYQFSRKGQDYALKIQKLDSYMGYMAWAEIYISQREKRQLGIQVLLDLIKEHNERPQAYLKLWFIYNLNNNNLKALELAEKLFIYGTGVIQTAEDQDESKASPNVASNIVLFRSCLITLLYAKSLFKSQELFRCYELLQNQFMAFPWFFSLLYAYAKYVIESDQINYLGSAIGALEECLRSQVKERHSNINYYLGKGYQKMKQPVKVFEYWKQYLITSRSNRANQDKKKDAQQAIEEYEDFCLLIQRVDHQIKQQQTTMNKSRINIIDLDGERYIEQLNSFASLDEQTKMLYRAKIFGFMLKDRVKATEQFEKLLQYYPTFLEGQLQYWVYLKSNKQYQQALIVAERTSQSSESTKIPTSQWVEARFNLSKSYLIGKQVKKAIDTLKEICYLLPPFPIEELPFIDSVLQAKDEDIIQRMDQDNEGITLRTPKDLQDDKNYFSFAVEGQTSHKKCESIQIVQVDEYKEQEEPNYFNEYRDCKRNLMVMQSLDSPFVLSQQVEVLELEDIEEGRATSQFGQENFQQPQRSIATNDQNSDKKQQQTNTIEVPTPTRNMNYLQMDSQKSILSSKKSFNYDAFMNNAFTNIPSNTQKPSNAQMSSARKRSSRFSFMNNSTKKSIVGIEGLLSFRNGIRESLASQNLTTQEDQKSVMDSEGFAVYSSVIFLFQIGKIAAETGKCLEDGFNALNDYLSIIEYYKLDMPEHSFDKLKLKANYYQGLIFYKVKDYEMAQQYLADIMIDLRDKGFQNKFENAQNKLAKIYRRLRREIITDYFR